MVTTIIWFPCFANCDNDYPVPVVWKFWQRLSGFSGLQIVTTIIQLLWFESDDDDLPVLVVWKRWRR